MTDRDALVGPSDEVILWMRQNAIDPETVIDFTANFTRAFMWRSREPWPLGGTYEADVPRDPGDALLATRQTDEYVLTILGEHPRAKEVQYDSSGTVTSTVRITEEGPWEPVEQEEAGR